MQKVVRYNKKKPAEQSGVFEESAVSFQPISVPTDDPSLRSDRRKLPPYITSMVQSLFWQRLKMRALTQPFHSSVYSRVGLCDPLRFRSSEMLACFLEDGPVN